MDTNALPMIGVTLIEDFVKNPPPYFQVQHCVRHPIIRPLPDQVNLCAHDKSHEAWFPDSMGRVLKVETVEQYDQLVERLLTRPLVFDVKLERRHKSGRIRYILKCDIIVTVNTSHPIIRSQMQKLLDDGREDIVNERNFAIDLNFDSILKGWFSTVHQGQDGIFDTSYNCAYARVVVTNSSEFNNLFSCSPEGMCLFLMCLPCCLFMCPVYRLSRCLTTVDHSGEVHGDVSYLTFKADQRTPQDQLLDMFRTYLLQQMIQQGRSRQSEQPHLGVPELTGLPSSTQPRREAYAVPPAHMFQPYATHHPTGNTGHVEHPVSPYNFQPPPPTVPGYTPQMAPPPPVAAPGYAPQMAPPPPTTASGFAPRTHPPPPTGAPAYAPQTSQPPGYASQMSAPPPTSAPGYAPPASPSSPQPELPSYEYVMGQGSDRDQLVT